MTGYVPMQYNSETKRMEFIPTKIALKAAVKSGRELPVINPSLRDEYERVDNATGVAIVGPDPYKNRKWYAQVDVLNGKIVKVK